jgi:hypothetical protein
MTIMVGDLPLASVARLKGCKPLAIVPGKILIDRGGCFAVLFFRIIQVGHRGVDHNAPRFLFLAVRAGGSSQAEGADKRRKGDALQYERDAYNAEREKDNHIPLGERAAIGKRNRKSEGGGEGDDSSHACPPEDEDLAESRRPLTLLEKPGPHQPGNECSWENPHNAQQNEENAEDRAVHHQRGETVSADGGANRRKLKSNENKDQPIQNKIQRFPDGPGLESNRGREEVGAAASEE